jgi:hypothetical protein
VHREISLQFLRRSESTPKRQIKEQIYRMNYMSNIV